MTHENTRNLYSGKVLLKNTPRTRPTSTPPTPPPPHLRPWYYSTNDSQGNTLKRRPPQHGAESLLVRPCTYTQKAQRLQQLLTSGGNTARFLKYSGRNRKHNRCPALVHPLSLLPVFASLPWVRPEALSRQFQNSGQSPRFAPSIASRPPLPRCFQENSVNRQNNIPPAVPNSPHSRPPALPDKKRRDRGQSHHHHHLPPRPPQEKKKILNLNRFND